MNYPRTSIYNNKWIAWGLILLSSCVSLPHDQQTENLLCPPSLETSANNSFKSSLFVEGEWPETNWWEIFEAHDLNALIAEALQQNPSLQGIERRIDYAKQLATINKARLFPLIFFDANETWEYLSHNGLYRALNPTVPINPNLIDLTLSFTYEFDFWGKNYNLYQAALGQAKTQEAEAAQVGLIITTSVAQAYFALKTNLIREQLYEQLVQLRYDLYQLDTLLASQALASKLPPLLSREQWLEAEKLLIGIQEEIAVDKHLMNALLGKGPDSPIELDPSLIKPLKSLSLPCNLSLDLLARRPDLMAQIWRVEALAHEVGAAKADFFPSINLAAFAGVESTLYSLLFHSSSRTAGLMPAIHLPIFTAGAIRANIKAKKALFDDAVYTYNELILRSAQEVADTLVLVQSVYDQQEKQRQIVNDAQERYDLTALRQQSGLDNLLDNYNYREALIYKELEQVNLVYSQYLATIKLIKALGGGYNSPYVPLRAE